MLFPTAALHIGNPFNAPNSQVKVPRKIAYCVYETGTYDNSVRPLREVPTEEYHLGWIEFFQRSLSLEDIDNICRTQPEAIQSVTLTQEKVHLRLAEEIQRSEVFPFEHSYSVLEIFLVDDPRPYLHPEAFREHPWNHISWDPHGSPQVLGDFDEWCFSNHEPNSESSSDSDSDDDAQPPMLLILEQEDSSDSDSDVQVIELVTDEADETDTDGDLWN